jgi:GNAT superfamily N-acetyltransferase
MNRPQIFIRNLDISDAAGVSGLSLQLGYNIPEGETQRNIQLMLENEDTAAFAAVANNELAGWITVACVISLTSAPVCEVRGLVVDEHYRKNNIGRMLVEKVIEWSRQKQCGRLRIRCNVKREDAHKFYRHLGFTEHKQQKVFEIDI